MTGILESLNLLFKKAMHSTKSLQELYPEYEIGRHTYGKPLICRFGKETALKIGSFCSFASDIKILLGGEHRSDWVTTYPFNVRWERAKGITGNPSSKGDVSIGNDVWVGTGVTILSGVTIGDGAIIGAGSVVTKDIAPYSIVAGNPARFIRNRFEDEFVTRLLKVRWWEWDDAVIEKNISALLSDNISGFLDVAERVGYSGH